MIIQMMLQQVLYNITDKNDSMRETRYDHNSVDDNDLQNCSNTATTLLPIFHS